MAMRRACGVWGSLTRGPRWLLPRPAPLQLRHGSTAGAPQQAVLTSRRVLQCTGQDVRKLLQGLVTQDVELLYEQPCLYTMLLNPKGRVLFDAFLHKDVSSPESVLVDCDAAVAEKLQRHLKMYMLRAKMKMLLRDDLHVRAYTGLDVGSPDPRCSMSANSVHRVVVPTDAADPPAVDGEFDYHQLRLLNGIGEGAADHLMGSSLPLECNLDLENGVSFTKGCYLGQELTSRTKHTGVVRKRLMPAFLSSTDGMGPLPCNVLSPDGKTVGKLHSTGTVVAQGGGGARAAGLGVFRLQKVAHADGPFTLARGENCDSGQEPIQVHPYFPSWWGPREDPAEGPGSDAPGKA